MADNSTPGSAGSGGPFFDFIAQLRRMADQALSAAQLSAMSSAVAAQRGSIEGLVAQLRAFDEQLEVLEQILGPLAEWSRTWAEMERSMLPPGTA